MNKNSNKIKMYTENRNVHRQNCECAGVLCTDGGLMSYLQMYSTGVCYVLFRWDMAWGGGGKNCSCVWLFWCSVLCSAGPRATDQRESEPGVRCPE